MGGGGGGGGRDVRQKQRSWPRKSNIFRRIKVGTSVMPLFRLILIGKSISYIFFMIQGHL